MRKRSPGRAAGAAFPSFAVAVTVLIFLAPRLEADDWPQWRGPRRDGVWREDGIAEKLPAKLRFRWRAPLGEGYAGPAVAGDRVYVTDRILDRGESNPDNPFHKKDVRGLERVLCLDAETGDVVWKHEYPRRYRIQYPFGPRATPTVDEGRVFTVGAMGDLFSLDARSGEVLWSRSYVDDFGTEMNAWGMAAPPLVDGENLIVLAGGRDGATVLALEKTSGKEVWRALSTGDPGYAPPMIYEAGGARQLIQWTPEHVSSLDPATGGILWQVPFEVKSGLSIAAPVYEPSERMLLVTAFYNGSVMLELAEDEPAAKVLWRGKSSSEIRTDGLHGLMCTPSIDDGYIYGVGSYGQLRCLRAKTGERVWETFEATGEGRWWNAFLIRHRDRYFIPNEQGELIIAKLSPKGYEEVSRSFLIAPTREIRRRQTVWSHPAFANRSVYARNDREIVCADLSAATYEKSAAAEGKRVSGPKRPKDSRRTEDNVNVERITPEEAKERLDANDGHRYLDVRTEEEFAAGHVPSAVNIPLLIRNPGAPGFAPNPDFTTEVEKRFPKDTKLIVGCQRGGRSLKACALLQSEGYTNVVDMRGGYDGELDPAGNMTFPGWARRGMPTERP